MGISIIAIVLGLLALAVFVGLIAAFGGSAERCARDAVKEIHKIETGNADQANIGAALKIVGGIALLMLTLVGVISITKGMGLGPMGKGIGILAFTGGAAALWAIVALVRRGRAKWLLAGLGVVAAGVAAVVGLTQQRSAGPAFDVVVQGPFVDPGQDFHAFPHHLKAGLEEVDVETESELYTATGEQISLGEEPEGPPAPANVPEPPAEVAGPANADLALGERTEPLPEWTKEPGVIVSEAFLTERLARDEAVQRVGQHAVEKYNEQGRGGLDRLPEGIDAQDLWDKFVTEEFVDRRKTSFGDTFVLHVRGELNEQVEAWFRDAADEYVVERQRQRGLMAVSAGGGGVLLVLSALYGALSMGEKRPAA